MSASHPPLDVQRVARSLGLKVPVYAHLRDALAAGEHPEWLRVADPVFAGLFPNALGFELLCERLHAEQGLERRRANLARAIDAHDGEVSESLRKAVDEAVDEGDLEDLALALEPSAAPADFETPEKEEQVSFLTALRGDAELARVLRRMFRDKATVRVDILEGKENDARPYQQYAGKSESLVDLSPASYLAMRRGEHARVLKVHFELPAADLRKLFDERVKSFPPQERDAYLKMFLDFVERERLGRLIQDARARLKRRSESYTLQQAWSQLENSLDRGHHDGIVLGLFAQRSQKTVVALLDKEGDLMRTAMLRGKDDGFLGELKKFLGDDRPSLAAVQADSPTRSVSMKVLEALRADGAKVRNALVPVAVVKTMLREVARRPSETHLSHDERQALLLARLASDPRAAAFHTPHVVRAYIPFRGEINHRRLEAFEMAFLRSLILGKGVDLNSASRDTLRLVPGLDDAAVEVERATAPFRSLFDAQARLGLEPADWRAAMCFLRVREGDEPLDARPLHPQYYGAVYAALNGSELDVVALLREPAKVTELEWKPVLEERGWPEKVVENVRHGLGRASRRPRRSGRPQDGGQRLEALEIGAMLKGKVTSLVPYGAFVDVGARREGLVHISEISAEKFVKDPSEVLEVGQEVTVRVVSIDVQRQRFRLSMRPADAQREAGGGREGREGGGGGRGRGGPRGGREERRPLAPGQRDSRPRSRPGGGRGGGGRDDDRRGGRGRRDRDDFKVGADPRGGKKEEIDPTNPFFQFFQSDEIKERLSTDGESNEKQQDSGEEAPA